MGVCLHTGRLTQPPEGHFKLGGERGLREALSTQNYCQEITMTQAWRSLGLLVATRDTTVNHRQVLLNQARRTGNHQVSLPPKRELSFVCYQQLYSYEQLPANMVYKADIIKEKLDASAPGTGGTRGSHRLMGE